MPESTMRPRVTMLGLGAMGSTLAAALLDAGYRTTVWNRTPGRAADLVAGRASAAGSLRDAVTAAPVVVACLYDYVSVRETLDPVHGELRGRTLVNLTTTTPNEARQLAAWASGHGIEYLDGAIMATPPMIGVEGAVILYSGSRTAYESNRPLLETWATSTYDGEDAGMASLFDLAMLSGMYTMFAGFLHGATMTGSAGVRAGEFASRATPFLAAMTGSFGSIAEVVDGGDYTDPQQSLNFTDPVLAAITRTSEEQGVDPTPIAMVRSLVRRQIARGHGSEDFDRIYESLRTPDPSSGSAGAA